MKYFTWESIPTWFALKDPPKWHVLSLESMVGMMSSWLSKMTETSSRFPKVFLNLRSSFYVSILKFSFE